MVAHEDDVRVAQGGGDAVALGLVQREALVVLVHLRPAVELQ